jgi:hypothetical protein
MLRATVFNTSSIEPDSEKILSEENLSATCSLEGAGEHFPLRSIIIDDQNSRRFHGWHKLVLF